MCRTNNIYIDLLFQQVESLSTFLGSLMTSRAKVHFLINRIDYAL